MVDRIPFGSFPALKREVAPVRLRLVEDDQGKHLLLPDGTEISGVSAVNVSIEPGSASKMVVELTAFDVSMEAARNFKAMGTSLNHKDKANAER